VQIKTKQLLTPHLDTAATAWAGCLNGEQKMKLIGKHQFMLPAIDNQNVWAGLKLTNDPD
jgi:hypothetical protein